MRHYLKEIETALDRFPKRTSRQVPEAYIGGGQSKLRYVGLKVPDLRATMKSGFSFSELPEDEIAAIWDFVWWNSDCFEVMALALMWFENPKRRPTLLTHWPLLKKWSARIDNWAHSDTLSGIYARMHEDSPQTVYPTFERWNRAREPWLRRLSIVSLLYYSSQREKYPPHSKITALLKPLLEDEHYYVQKGVGWTLREAGNVYPAETLRFVEKNLDMISAHAFSAASEKMPATTRERLKRMRKKRR